MLGALGGVYQANVDVDAIIASGFGPTWGLYGVGLPDVQVSSLDYVAADDLLIAGTYGRGAWEIQDVSSYFGAPLQTTISDANQTILLEQDPTQAGYGEVLTDAPGSSISQVLADDDVLIDEPWVDMGTITFDVQSETVDILNVPISVSVTIDAGAGNNTVNLGSATNLLTTIQGSVSIGNGSLGANTFVNVNDQGDKNATGWTIGGGTISGQAFPGIISFQDLTSLVLNAASIASNQFLINNITGTAALTLNTGAGDEDSVSVNETSNATTLHINNQGMLANTNISATGPGTQTDINDSGTDTIILGNSTTGAQGLEGNIAITTTTPDSDGLTVNDRNDVLPHTGIHAVTISTNSITGLARGTISYGPHTLKTLLLYSSGFQTVWNVQGTPIPYSYFQGVSGGVLSVTAPTTTTIYASSQDIVNVGDPTDGLKNIFGTLNVYAPTSSATVNLNLNDDETTYQTPQTVNVTNTSVSGLGTAIINYGLYEDGYPTVAGGMSELTVQAGVGGTTFQVADMTDGPTNVNLSAEVEAGTTNTIQSEFGSSTSLDWTFQGHINSPLDSYTQGTGASAVYFNGMNSIIGGPGGNDFQFINTGFDGSIDGGTSGLSTLDFQRYGGTSLSVETLADGSSNGVQGTASDGTIFDDIDSVVGDPSADWIVGNTTAQAGTYQGNFTHSLTVAGFANFELNVSGDFSGQLMAESEGTAANPISSINVNGSVDLGALIKVGFLLNFTVEGNFDGTIKGFGDHPPDPSIQTIVIDGAVNPNGMILAKVVTSVEVEQDFAGILSESEILADFQTITIGGSFLVSGLIDAASGGTLSVSGNFSGQAVIAGELDSLIVGGTLDGVMSAGQYGAQQLDGPVTGQLDTGLPTAPPVTIAAGDTAALIQAIDDANLIAQPSVINLAPNATYLLTTPDNDTNGPNGLPAIYANITINGNGSIIERAAPAPFRIFQIETGAALVLAALVIKQGTAPSGGAIDNAGTLTLDDDLLADNAATGNGGAVYNSGTMTASGTTYSGNTAGGSGPNVFDTPAQTPTTTTLSDDGPNSSTLGQSVQFTVSVAGGVPNGELVVLEDASNGNIVVATGSLTSGTANLTVTNLNGGAHNLFAVYGGDSSLTGSQSATVTQTVYQSPDFTSAAEASFAVASTNSFAVAASGYLTPTISEKSNDILPPGLSFDPATGILSGTPALGTVGVYTLHFTADNGVGTDATQTFTLTIAPATPVITWDEPSAITYGTPLDGSQFDATANVPGTFVYTQSVGTVLTAIDTPLLSVTFTPDDTADYATVIETLPIQVNPAPLDVYANPQTITFGSTVPTLTFSAFGFLSGDTAASLEGSLATVATSSSPVGVYDITLGTLGSVGSALNCMESNYSITYIGAEVTVIPALPAVTWTPPAPIDDQTPLTALQLDATTTVPGTFVYSPAVGTRLSAGSQTLYATFTPDDTIDYQTVTTSVPLTVAIAAAPVISIQPTSQSVSAGDPAEFSAAASGGPIPAVSWQVNQGTGYTTIIPDNVYSVDESGALLISTVTASMSGYQYQAIFTNASGSVTTTHAILNVALFTTAINLVDYGPFPADNTASIALTVIATGGIPDGESINIEDATNSDDIVPTTGNTLAGGEAEITIPPGALAGGIHDLFAAYSGDGTFAMSQSPLLTQEVDSAPTLTLQPTKQTVAPGSTATFTAQAVGYPVPTVEWQQSTDGGNIWTIIPNATSPTLTLPDVSAAQSGTQYRAVFTSTLGAVLSNPATLTSGVTPIISPLILAPIPIQNIDVGQTLEFNLSTYVSNPNSSPSEISYSLAANSPSGLSISPSTGIISWTPGFDQTIGSRSVIVLLSDTSAPGLDSSTVVVINLVDRAPLTVASAVVSDRKGLTIALTFSSALDPATAANAANYLLTEPAKKPKSKKKPTPAPTAIKLNVTFDQVTNQAILHSSKSVKLSPALELTLIGTGSTSIAKPDGLQLAGNGETAGTNYVASVTTKKITPTAAIVTRHQTTTLRELSPAKRIHPSGPINLIRPRLTANAIVKTGSLTSTVH